MTDKRSFYFSLCSSRKGSTVFFLRYPFGDLLPEKGRGRFNNPEKIVKSIQRAITMSYRLGGLAQESINVVLSILVRTIRVLEKNIKDLVKALEQLVVVIPEYQCSIY